MTIRSNRSQLREKKAQNCQVLEAQTAQFDLRRSNNSWRLGLWMRWQSKVKTESRRRSSRQPGLNLISQTRKNLQQMKISIGPSLQLYPSAQVRPACLNTLDSLLNTMMNLDVKHNLILKVELLRLRSLAAPKPIISHHSHLDLRSKIKTGPTTAYKPYSHSYRRCSQLRENSSSPFGTPSTTN